MKIIKNIRKENLLILIVLFLAGFLRFWKLDWGEGYYFHPDEYHIAIAVNKISFPNQMDPGLYSYGSFIVYLNYFLGILLNTKSYFLLGRGISAFFSTLSVYLVYLLLKRVSKSNLLIITGSLLVAILPGFVQQAHFATPEATLGFFILLFSYFLIKAIEKGKHIFFYLSISCIGLAAGVKTIGIILIPIWILILVLYVSKTVKKETSARVLFFIFVSIFLLMFSYFLSFPYSIINWDDFIRTFKYEGGLGTGKQIVFYTRSFLNTKPFVHQSLKVFPYTLGLFVYLGALVGFVMEINSTVGVFIKKGFSKKVMVSLVMILVFSSFFIANGILFLKWTRFMYPTLPFLVIYCVYFLGQIKIWEGVLLFRLMYALVVATSLGWSLMFLNVYKKGDIRLIASSWINQNINNQTIILTETGNTLEVPLYGNYKKISFDFYNLETSKSLQSELLEYLTSADFFIIQSRRIYYNHLRLEKQFPITSGFYKSLFSGELGFYKIKQFNSFPELNLFGKQMFINDVSAEETWSVFDHPEIEVYQKINGKSIKEYKQILSI